jgi:hypothetical protein
MRSSADYSSVVDVYDGNTRAWSTAELSVARSNLAAASVGNVALFAGGFNFGVLFRTEWSVFGADDRV